MCLLEQSHSQIFTYHSIVSKFHLGLNVIHPDTFRRHVEFIAKINKSTVIEKPILIAFDDGYESVFNNAFPVMEEYGLKGIVFPVTGYIGKSNDWDVTFGINKAKHLTETQIFTLSDNGWEFGSHGHLHRPFNILSNNQINKELLTSKHIIQEITGKKVLSICPPFGVLTANAIEIMEDIGFTNLFIQLPFRKKYKSLKLRFHYSRSIYTTDGVKSLQNKYQNFKWELLKENFIHSFSRATVLAKQML